MLRRLHCRPGIDCWRGTTRCSKRTPRRSIHSFRSEIDANVFPCLGDWAGCHRLMHEIRGKQGFLPEATWLIAHDAGERSHRNIAARSRAFAITPGLGAIQNLGVTPEHRGRDWAHAC